MGLYQRKDSNIWQMCFFMNGKKIRMSTKTTNKKVATRIYEKAKVEAAEGKFFLNTMSKMPFDKLVSVFLEKHCKVERTNYNSECSICRSLKKYFEQAQIGKITAYDIKSWRQWRKGQISERGTPIANATLNRELSSLKTMFNLAVEWGWLPDNPARTIKLLKGVNKRLRFLNRDEIQRLIDYAAPHLKPVIITAVTTGMRKSEILNLEWKNVSFEQAFIHVEKTKNKRPRDIPISPYLEETLKKLERSREIGKYVFCNAKGDRRLELRPHFKNALEKAGIEDFRFHDLRHTAASWLASNGLDLITLMYVLGHQSLEMTRRYAHLIPEKHQRTRQIMESLWRPAGDTDGAIPLAGYSGK